MTQVRKGTSALGTLNDQGGNNSAEITSLKSGTTLTVRVKGTEDLAQYYGYSVYKKVNTFVPKNPAERNERGFITGNPTPWDLAAQYYFDEAKKLKDAGDEKGAEEVRKEAFKYNGKKRYLMGFYDLTTGNDIVVDLSRKQAQAVYAVIEKNAKKIDRYAFELSKTGESTSTTVMLSLVPDAEDLTPDQRKNFEASAGQPFDDSLFDGVLYEADDAEMIELLDRAGFDVDLIGLTAPDKGDEAEPIDDNAEQAEDPAVNF